MLKALYVRVQPTIARYSLAALVLVHVVGIIGMLSPFRDYFKLLTPVNLLFSGFLLWLNHKERNAAFTRFIILTIAFGFLVECIGVNFGLLFGEYAYGKTLGPKLLNVPVIIGLNWLLIIYSTATLTDSLKIHALLKLALGASLAVFMDWTIEPVAMKFDFWTWKNGIVPAQNYIGWFLTSLALLSAYHVLRVKAENKLALPYYFVQLLFFVIIRLFI